MGQSRSFQESFAKWYRAKEIAQQEGGAVLVRKTIKKAKRFIWQTNCSTWFERTLEQPIVPFQPEIDIRTEFLVQDKSKLVNWLESNHERFPWIYFERELETAELNDHIFVVLSHEDTIIGYVKIGVNLVYINDFHAEVSFPEGTAFIYDTFILPDYRGKQLAMFALNQSMQHLIARGYNRLLCHIEKWNVPSIKTFERAGFVSKGALRYLRITRFSCYLRKGYALQLSLEDFLQAK